MKITSLLSVCLFFFVQPAWALENIATANIYVKPDSVVDMSETGVEIYIPYVSASNLPTSVSAGAIAIITDSNGVDCSGGGSEQAVCIYNGTAWALSYASVPSTPNVAVIYSTNCIAENASDGTVCFTVNP